MESPQRPRHGVDERIAVGEQDLRRFRTNDVVAHAGTTDEVERLQLPIQPRPPAPELAADLEAAGADFLVIPCNTAYVYQDAILAATHIPLISIIGVSIAAAMA